MIPPNHIERGRHRLVAVVELVRRRDGEVADQRRAHHVAEVEDARDVPTVVRHEDVVGAEVVVHGLHPEVSQAWPDDHGESLQALPDRSVSGPVIGEPWGIVLIEQCADAIGVLHVPHHIAAGAGMLEVLQGLCHARERPAVVDPQLGRAR